MWSSAEMMSPRSTDLFTKQAFDRQCGARQSAPVSLLGQRVLRTEDARLLSSGGTYVADVAHPLLDGCVHLHFVRSPFSHARITHIETGDARVVPGVRGVFTGVDIDIGPMPPVLPRFDPALSPPLLAHDIVRYVGESIAVVAADTQAAAADGAERVLVDYDPLPAGTPLFAHLPDGVAATYSAGADADGLFDGCEVVVDVRLSHPRTAACPMEARAAASVWDSSGRLHHWLSVQAPHAVKMGLQTLFGLDAGLVHVIAPDVGGGFGPKFSNYPEDVVTAWVARRLGRAARWCETRSESMVGLHHGRAQVQTIRLGGTRAGALLAYELEVEQDAGAYASLGVYVPEATLRMTTGVYAIPRARATATVRLSATTPVSAFRGSGRPEATGALERAVDVFAREIGMDPVDVRRCNLVTRDEFPFTTAVGTVYDTGDYERALDVLLDAVGYQELRAAQRRLAAAGDRTRTGIGVSLYVESTAAGPAMEFGTVTLRRYDGTSARTRLLVTVATGSMPHGQGHDTTWSMVAGDALGLPIDAIEVVHGDTDRVPAGLGTYSSRSVQLAGSAVRRACEGLVARARGVAADLLEVAPDDTVFDRGRGCFHVAGTPARTVDWARLATYAHGEALSESAMFTGSMTFPFGAHLAVVELDTETGSARVTRLVAVDDAGTIVNPLLAEGQLHGGLAQGIAEALFEEMRFDEHGNPLTTNFADYAIVTAAELPSFELHPMETPTDVNPLGAKGIGEAGTIGAVAAVRNAVCDALGAHLDAPLTPERIWRRLAAAGLDRGAQRTTSP
jgi:aerobic carbon-monoxide dehydrogenase large subunit